MKRFLKERLIKLSFKRKRCDICKAKTKFLKVIDLDTDTYGWFYVVCMECYEVIRAYIRWLIRKKHYKTTSEFFWNYTLKAKK